ncbi:spermatogenesis-associated protein 7 isoform X2 [Tachyglossus aculeatus]|uniref:spermatogenesis-associated protein 7 isoform X2 n=1 Tax=Tachyglossus aculeatus TaxID=9261 RepID=UPI0018F53912|nr:spermatogenesis-associated protein 7 isoform X2 [Tachyglossus aculeatus]
MIMDSNRRGRTSAKHKYVPSSPFKGHLSTKSNAAVDCSVPNSMLTSIKYVDQQRREKLKKDLANFSSYSCCAKSSSLPSSRSGSRTHSAIIRKTSLDSQDNDKRVPQAENECPYSARSDCPSEKPYLGPSHADKVVRGHSRKICSSSISDVGYRAQSPRKKYCGVSYSPSADSIPKTKCPRNFQDPASNSGDLLDRHSEHFTERQLPFTPRTLKSEAKSFLAQYRYYTPARRKMKDSVGQQAEAETQTELSSFNSGLETTENVPHAKVKQPRASSYTTCGNIEKRASSQTSRNSLTWDQIKDDASQNSFSRATSPSDTQSSTVRKTQSEEELLYLSFIQEITDEILKLGLFSNRVLDRLFEYHISQNRHHLEEAKMRHLLHILKVDLGCITEEKSERLNASFDNFDLFDSENFSTSEQLANEDERVMPRPESREFQQALDLLSVEQEEMNSFQAICSKKSSGEDASARVNVGTDFEPLVDSDEEQDVSHTVGPVSSVNSTQSDFENINASGELGELSELGKLGKSFTEHLQLSNGEDDYHEKEEWAPELFETGTEDYSRDL